MQMRRHGPAFLVMSPPFGVGRRYGMGSMIYGAPSAIASAIAQAEGYGVAGAIPTLANNPGDLELGDIGYGTLGEGITVFASISDGWAALENQINSMVSGQSSLYSTSMTIAQVGQVYSGSSSPNWSNNVAAALGVSPNANFAAQVTNPGTQAPAEATAGATSIDFSNLLPSLSTSPNAPLYAAGGILGLLALAVILS